MKISSQKFEDEGFIPAKYTCDGDGVNPPLAIDNVPSGTKSLALIVDDPDVPKQIKPDGVFDHWVLFNMPPDTTQILENSAPGMLGANGTGKTGYMGPCPPPQYEPSTHRYVFALYALDTELSLPEGATKDEVQSAMEGHILAEARLVGLYTRK